MKKNIHPKYQKILFVDSSTGHKFVCGSTLQPKDSEKFEGVDYPVYRLSTSSASHPFFTGSKTILDAEGRVDKFKKRYSNATATQQKLQQGSPEEKKQERDKGQQGSSEEKKQEKGKGKGKKKPL